MTNGIALVACRDPKFRSIFSMLYDTNRDADLFAKYDVHDIFECRILSVDPTYRGKGIARSLMERSIQEARLRGFKLFKVYFLTSKKLFRPFFREN
jgi:GNAT superfamily N-acetyltransferase